VYVYVYVRVCVCVCVSVFVCATIAGKEIRGGAGGRGSADRRNRHNLYQHQFQQSNRRVGVSVGR